MTRLKKGTTYINTIGHYKRTAAWSRAVTEGKNKSLFDIEKEIDGEERAKARCIDIDWLRFYSDKIR